MSQKESTAGMMQQIEELRALLAQVNERVKALEARNGEDAVKSQVTTATTTMCAACRYFQYDNPTNSLMLKPGVNLVIQGGNHAGGGSGNGD